MAKSKIKKEAEEDGIISQDEIDRLLSGESDSVAKNDDERDSDFTVTEKPDSSQKSKDSDDETAKKAKRAEKWEKRSKIRKDEVLTQDEVDQLLQAITSSDDEDESDGENEDNKNTRRKIKIYDFMRPDRFSKEQIRQMSLLFESTCMNLTTHFSSKLHSLCHFHVASVDQLTFEEFIRSIPTPTTLGCAMWEGEKTVLEIDPSLTFEFLFAMYSDKLDRLDTELSDLDLSEEQQDDVSCVVRSVFSNNHIIRDLTDMEVLLMKELVIKSIYKFCTDSFNDGQGKNDFHFASSKPKNSPKMSLSEPSQIIVECNPQFAVVVPPSEMVMLVTIEGKIGDEEGMINVCLPYPFVKNVLLEKEILMKTTTGNRFGLQVIPGNSAVSLGEFNMPENEKLEVGAIIELDKLAGEAVDLFDKKTGKVFAKGEVVVIDENFGVRVTEVIDSDDKKSS